MHPWAFGYAPARRLYRRAGSALSSLFAGKGGVEVGAQTADGGDAADGLVVECDVDLGAEGEVQVYTRAEFNEAHVVFDACLHAGVGVGDDAAGHRSGNLAHKYLLAFGGASFSVLDLGR